MLRRERALVRAQGVGEDQDGIVKVKPPLYESLLGDREHSAELVFALLRHEAAYGRCDNRIHQDSFGRGSLSGRPVIVADRLVRLKKYADREEYHTRTYTLTVVEFITHLLETLFAQYGYLIIFVAMLIENASGIGSLIPGDTLLILAGYFTRGTGVSLPLLILVGVTGAVIGDNLSYLVGRKYGHRLIAWLERRWQFLYRRLRESERYFKRHGGKTVLFGRNVAIVRTYVPLLAGMGRMPYGRFFIYNIIGAALQISVFLMIGYFFGQYRDQIESVLRNTGFVLIGLAIIIALILYRRRAKRDSS